MLLIQNGTLHTMESDAPIRADLLIEEGKIEKIAPNITPRKHWHVFNGEGLHI